MSFSVRKSLDSIIGLLTILFVNNVFNPPLLLQGYMVSLFNRFDFFVVCSSILEYTLVKFEVGVKTVFVCFHIFASLPWMNFVRLCHPWVSLLWGVSVFWEPSKSRSKWKLLKIDLQLPLLSSHRYWKAMGGLVKSLVDSIASIVALLVLLVLFIFIFALLGMQVPSLPRQLFSLLWIFFPALRWQIWSGGFPRHFWRLLPSLLHCLPGFGNPNIRDSSFIIYDNGSICERAPLQILTGEDWNVVMYDGIQVSHRWCHSDPRLVDQV